MSANIIVRNAEDYQVSVWSGGTTTQLYIYPEDGDYKSGEFQVRISSATVEIAKSEFTNLPGVKRYLMIFDGHLDMIHGVNTRVELEPYEVDVFDGGKPTVSYGKVTDFNLMLKNGADGKMEAAIIPAGEPFCVEKEEKENLLCIYVREGVLEAEGKKAEIDRMLLTYTKQPAKLEGTSIGILNVQKRNKLLCGREYGLTYTENPTGGVTAHLLLPMREEGM